MHLMSYNVDSPQQDIPKRIQHEIKKKEGKFNSIKRRCKICYRDNVKKFGTDLARRTTVKVATFCDSCPDKPHLCLSCFNKVHRDML